MAADTCGTPCPTHGHTCARSPLHTEPCRDRKQKGTHSCEWTVKDRREAKR